MTRRLYLLVRNHGTKLLGVAQGIIAAVAAVPDVIPPGQLKYYMATLAVLTYLRGQFSPLQPQKT